MRDASIVAHCGQHLETHFAARESHFAARESHFAAMQSNFAAMESNFAAMESNFAAMESNFEFIPVAFFAISHAFFRNRRTSAFAINYAFLSQLNYTLMSGPKCLRWSQQFWKPTQNWTEPYFQQLMVFVSTFRSRERMGRDILGLFDTLCSQFFGSSAANSSMAISET